MSHALEAPTPHVIRLAASDGPERIGAALAAAGLPVPSPVVVLVGGAGGLRPDQRAVCVRLFGTVLVPFLERHAVCLVDGGTDSGVMSLAGKARHAAGARGPHVGVAAAGTILVDGAASGVPGAADPASAEPHHTHLVVVPGGRWGDEAPWISAVAAALAGPRACVTVLANGGAIAYEDVRHSLAAGRPVLVLTGTGRTADALAAARVGTARPVGPAPPTAPPPADVASLARSPLVHLVADEEEFEAALGGLLLRGTP